MSDLIGQELLREARERMLRELGAIADAVTRDALTRCPFRNAGDGCTFEGGCRNRVTGGSCTGHALDPTPAP